MIVTLEGMGTFLKGEEFIFPKRERDFHIASIGDTAVYTETKISDYILFLRLFASTCMIGARVYNGFFDWLKKRKNNVDNDKRIIGMGKNDVNAPIDSR